MDLPAARLTASDRSMPLRARAPRRPARFDRRTRLTVPLPGTPQTDATTSAAAAPVIALGETYGPLQQFVSQQALEVAMLSMQVDRAKADHNPGLARTLTHMIRDHVLAENAAQDVLARRGEV